MIFCIFYKVNNLFLHQSYLKSPLPVKLTWWKMQKIIFYYWKNSKIPKVPSSADNISFGRTVDAQCTTIATVTEKILQLIYFNQTKKSSDALCVPSDMLNVCCLLLYRGHLLSNVKKLQLQFCKQVEFLCQLSKQSIKLFGQICRGCVVLSMWKLICEKTLCNVSDVTLKLSICMLDI